MTQLGGLLFTYDKSDQPTYVSGTASGTYTYDGNLKRVKSVVDGKTIYNVYNAAGKLTFVDKATDGVRTEYLGDIARVRNNVPTWLHMDHLGSSQTATDANGQVVWRQQFTPHGETLNALTVNNDLAGFTGHIKDSATGLNYMQARYYDPLIGRFLSIDPVGFSPEQPFMFGRYSYVGNDPVNATDPFGLCTGSRLKESRFCVGGGSTPRDNPDPIIAPAPKSPNGNFGKGSSRTPRGGSSRQNPNYNEILAAKLRYEIRQNDPGNPAGTPTVGRSRTSVDLDALRQEVVRSKDYKENLRQIELYSKYPRGNYSTNIVATRSEVNRMG